MKKFKRIICIVMTMLICFSAFACTDGCLRTCKRVLNVNLIKMGREEAEKQKMALDSVQKQVDGYKLVGDYTTQELKADGEWVELEDWNMLSEYECGAYNGTYNGNVALGIILGTEEDIIYLQVEEDNKIIEKVITIDYSIAFAQYKVIESYRYEAKLRHLYCCDGVWFLICMGRPEFTLGGFRCYLSETILPPLFYLLDFENNTMYYAGYADDWYENAAKMDYFGQSGYWNFKIAKVVKDENNK